MVGVGIKHVVCLGINNFRIVEARLLIYYELWHSRTLYLKKRKHTEIFTDFSKE